MKPNNIFMPSPLPEPQAVPEPVTAMAPPTPIVDPTTATLSYGGQQSPYGGPDSSLNLIDQPMVGLMGVQSSGVEQLLQPIISRIQSQSQQQMAQKLPAYVQQISEITNTTFPNLFTNGIGSIPNQYTNSLQSYQNQMNPMMASLFK
tara:strand:+ start:462 stop:902 length:441 start_codon:yes stop_codon:yes gene_type:complete